MTGPRSAFSEPNRLGPLLTINLAGFLLIFISLEFWRPCYFLTDDNLSGFFPVLTGMGRQLKTGQPFYEAGYIFGGHYNLLRDIGCLDCCHPFYLLASLLADTAARFWMLDLVAFLFLLLAVVGFTLLAHALRKEFNPRLPDIYLAFYSLSFLFSTYVLTVGPSWINFLGNFSALPWLALGLLERRMVRGTLVITLFTVHEVLGGYAGQTLSNDIWLTLFAVGVSLSRRSAIPLLAWVAGNIFAVLLLSPLLHFVLDGFAHTARASGLSIQDLSDYSVPPSLFSFSYFLGNWTEPVTFWLGDRSLKTLTFPYLSSLLACAAAWCIVPALFSSRRWRILELFCLGIALVLAVFIIRPHALSEVIVHVPLFKSLRKPFREGIQFLFFIHLFFILRPQEQLIRWRPVVALLSLAAFLLPLPFVRAPTLNPLKLDRQLLFSGEADAFWSRVKTLLRPDDKIATLIKLSDMKAAWDDVPYTLLGTANFPVYFQVTSISGYSPMAPRDQQAVTVSPDLWFGAFDPGQMSELLAEQPRLKFIVLSGVNPLRISLISDGKSVDLTPFARP